MAGKKEPIGANAKPVSTLLELARQAAEREKPKTRTERALEVIEPAMLLHGKGWNWTEIVKWLGEHGHKVDREALQRAQRVWKQTEAEEATGGAQ